MSKASRDAKLTRLLADVKLYGSQEKGRLEKELLWLKSLQALTGAGQITATNVTAASPMVVDEISEFLK